MNNFILSYNPFGISPTEGQLLNHVQFNRFVSQYYQPFIGTYVVKSEQTVAQLTASLKGLFEAAPFIITQVLPNWVGGTLPQDIWHWINYGYMPPAISQPPITNYLGLLAEVQSKTPE